MTREETVKIIRIMSDCYPNYKPNNLSETVDVWQMMLDEYSYNQVSIALKAYVTSDTSGFAPSIGQLVEKIRLVENPRELNEMEAWFLVSKAIRNGFYGSVEEFRKLPDIVKEAVGSPENIRNWATSDYEAIETVIQSNFMRTYRSVLKRSEELRKMPSDIKLLIEKTNQNSYKAQIEQKFQKSINVPKIENTHLNGENTKPQEHIGAPDWVRRKIEIMKRER